MEAPTHHHRGENETFLPRLSYPATIPGFTHYRCLAATTDQFGSLCLWTARGSTCPFAKDRFCLPVPGAIKNAQQHLDLQNRLVEPTEWYLGVTKSLLKRFAGSEVELILDATDLCDRNPMLFVAARYKGRAFSLFWRMLYL